jgi:imidazolonepropionase-like amidohydrolase
MMANLDHVLIKTDKIFSRSKGFLKGYHMLIKNGIIERISNLLKSVPDTKTLDYSSYTITPPFCDHHLHFFNKSQQFVMDAEQALLKYGIQTVYDGGDSHINANGIRNSFRSSVFMNTPVYALYKKGGYGKFLGKGAENIAHALQFVDEVIKHNADYIKIINSGVFDPEKATITKGGFEKEELKEIVAYASSKGLDVFCHANGDSAIRNAIDAGVKAIIHGFFISDESLSLMARSNTSFIPTIGALSSLSEIAKSKNTRDNVLKLVDQHLSAIRKASEYGITILAGSDAGPSFIPYGRSFYNELEWFRKAGLSHEQILASATCGDLAVGQKADFLVLDGLSIKETWRQD